MNNGKEYEILTSTILSHVIKNKINPKDTDLPIIKHNQKINNGKRERQCDLCWNIPLGTGIEQTLIVECKDWKNKVPVSVIESFALFINEGNNLRGVYVTKTGYQKGALEVSENYKIQPLIIRESNVGEFFEIKEIHIKLHSIEPNITNVSIDAPNIVNELHANTGDYFIVNDNERIDVLTIVQDLVREDFKKQSNTGTIREIVKIFDNGYLDDGVIRPLPKINSISISYEVIDNIIEFSVPVKNSQKFIYEDVLNGDKYVFTEDHGLVKVDV